MTPEVIVSRLAREKLDELEPLWAALYDHHQETSPQLEDRRRKLEDSWRDRRAQEEHWLASDEGSFVLAAQAGGVIVGYACVRVIAGPMAVSWEFSDPYAKLETLSIAPGHRGEGIGSALMDAVYTELRKLDIGDLAIEVITTNTRAARFYERLGAVPFLTTYIHRVPAGDGVQERCRARASSTALTHPEGCAP